MERRRPNKRIAVGTVTEGTTKPMYLVTQYPLELQMYTQALTSAPMIYTCTADIDHFKCIPSIPATFSRSETFPEPYGSLMDHPINDGIQYQPP